MRGYVMARKFNVLVDRARTASSSRLLDRPVKADAGVENSPAGIYSPMKEVFEVVVTAGEIFGFEFLRVEPDEHIIVFDGADTKDKKLFLTAFATPNDMELKAGFAIGDMDELRPLFRENTSFEISYSEVEVPVFDDNENTQRKSEVRTQTKMRAIYFVFNDGDVKHYLANIACAPTVRLKGLFEPTLSISLDLQTSFVEFTKHAKRLKSAERFGIEIKSNVVKFRVGQQGSHHAYVNMGACNDGADVGRHEFEIRPFLKTIKFATEIGSGRIVCNIDRNTGLMKLDFDVLTKYDEPIAFHIILPGNLN
ncbi:hypothetical protein CCP1ISM_40012 [Azospirillaceae bacterium]